MYKLNSMIESAEGSIINWKTEQKKSLRLQHRHPLCSIKYGNCDMELETFKVDTT